MRVVAGSARGRRLKTPEGRAIRPSTDRIRESMFNLLGPGHLAECVLDAFAGTGALGIEALSRGVQQATFIDRDPKALALVRQNLGLCGFDSRARVRRGDALALLPGVAVGCDLVFLDPPYRQGLVEACLEILGDGLLSKTPGYSASTRRNWSWPKPSGSCPGSSRSDTGTPGSACLRSCPAEF
mgnify:CR=1 FL=1